MHSGQNRLTVALTLYDCILLIISHKDQTFLLVHKNDMVTLFKITFMIVLPMFKTISNLYCFAFFFFLLSPISRSFSFSYNIDCFYGFHRVFLVMTPCNLVFRRAFVYRAHAQSFVEYFSNYTHHESNYSAPLDWNKTLYYITLLADISFDSRPITI